MCSSWGLELLLAVGPLLQGQVQEEGQELLFAEGEGAACDSRAQNLR